MTRVGSPLLSEEPYSQRVCLQNKDPEKLKEAAFISK